MDLKLNLWLASTYSNSSQVARIITEDWLKSNSYCPNCGNQDLENYVNNKPVADFLCSICMEDYELKSKNGKLGNIIVDGAYSTMLQRINSEKNPNFFFLTYSKMNWCVDNLIIIPKHFFSSEIIIKRNPLALAARRSGWIGCNINLEKVPALGRIFLIRNSLILEKQSVLESWKKTLFLRKESLATRGWTLDILQCIDKIKKEQFSLAEIYNFENELKLKHPKNNFIKDKTRQQLQILRDKGIIEFTGKGNYKKL
jgi:type II restriction enzyme